MSAALRRCLPAAPRRYFDAAEGRYIVKLHPGEHYVTADPAEMLVTVLGSCIAACIRDPDIGIGGMNHFMLPDGGEDAPVAANRRYGTFAMEQLVNDILKAGGRRERLEVKLFGGARILHDGMGVGARNVVFIEQYVTAESLMVLSRSLGGDAARKILYWPDTGKVRQKLVPMTATDAVRQEERAAFARLKAAPVEGDVELFT